MSNIHKTAVIDKLAQLDDNVSIGPYSIIGPNVEIGSGTVIGPHVVIEGNTTIGQNNNIYQFASLGAIPQDKKYNGEDTKLIIGDNNTIREFCTINIGTITGIGKTVIGNNNWIMAYVHIAHDCSVGNNIIFANNTSLAGHVVVKDFVVFGGFSLIYQFCTIGDYAMTAFATGVHKNIPPYVMAYGFRAKPSGINSEGLRRNNFTKEQIFNIKQAYKILYRNDLSFDEAVKRIKFMNKSNPELKNMVSFLDKIEQRGIIR